MEKLEIENLEWKTVEHATTAAKLERQKKSKVKGGINECSAPKTFHFAINFSFSLFSPFLFFSFAVGHSALHDFHFHRALLARLCSIKPISRIFAGIKIKCWTFSCVGEQIQDIMKKIKKKRGKKSVEILLGCSSSALSCQAECFGIFRKSFSVLCFKVLLEGAPKFPQRSAITMAETQEVLRSRVKVNCLPSLFLLCEFRTRKPEFARKLNVTSQIWREFMGAEKKLYIFFLLSHWNNDTTKRTDNRV